MTKPDLTSDVGADVAYHLSQNRALAAQILKMNRCNRKGNWSHRGPALSRQKPRTETKAPDQINPVRGSAAAAATLFHVPTSSGSSGVRAAAKSPEEGEQWLTTSSVAAISKELVRLMENDLVLKSVGTINLENRTVKSGGAVKVRRQMQYLGQDSNLDLSAFSETTGAPSP